MSLKAAALHYSTYYRVASVREIKYVIGYR